MGRFDIFANPGTNSQNVPYLVDVQCNVISGLATRIVVPLRPLSRFASESLPGDLFPVIEVEGQEYFFDIPQLGAIPVGALKTKVGSANAKQSEIQSALDRAFGAY